MDPVRNPFAPGAGNPPPELAGRAEILATARIALKRAALGRATKSQILVGLRGVGKTVLLNRTQALAEEEGFRVIYLEAHEDKSLPQLLAPALRSLLVSLSHVEQAKDAVRRGFRILGSFLSAMKLSHGESGFEFSFSPEVGVASSGDIELDLPELLLGVAQTAAAAHTPVAIIIDEMQYFPQKEFSALIMSIHRVNQNLKDGKQLPMIMFGAGLPHIHGLAGDSKSYAERLFGFPDVGPLSEQAAKEAILRPVQEEEESIEDAAINKIIKITEGYPYFLQQWAHDAWNRAEGNLITAADVEAATPRSIAELDRSFFKVRFDRCTPSEKRYMRALAELGPGSHRSGDVAEILGVKSTSVAPTRGYLIKKGMIYSKAHGDVAFTVPLFDEYMRRAMPELEAQRPRGKRT